MVPTYVFLVLLSLNHSVPVANDAQRYNARIEYMNMCTRPFPVRYMIMRDLLESGKGLENDRISCRACAGYTRTSLRTLELELLLKAANQLHNFVCWMLITGERFRHRPLRLFRILL